MLASLVLLGLSSAPVAIVALTHKGNSENCAIPRKACETWLIRNLGPFQFRYERSNEACGPLSCPWPIHNTCLRFVTSVACIILAITNAGLITRRSGALRLLRTATRRAWYSAAHATSLMMLVACLLYDAESLARGTALCASGFWVHVAGVASSFRALTLSDEAEKIKCEPSVFVATVCVECLAFISFSAMCEGLLRWYNETEYRRMSDVRTRRISSSLPSVTKKKSSPSIAVAARGGTEHHRGTVTMAPSSPPSWLRRFKPNVIEAPRDTAMWQTPPDVKITVPRKQQKAPQDDADSVCNPDSSSPEERIHTTTRVQQPRLQGADKKSDNQKHRVDRSATTNPCPIGGAVNKTKSIHFDTAHRDPEHKSDTKDRIDKENRHPTPVPGLQQQHSPYSVSSIGDQGRSLFTCHMIQDAMLQNVATPDGGGPNRTGSSRRPQSQQSLRQNAQVIRGRFCPVQTPTQHPEESLNQRRRRQMTRPSPDLKSSPIILSTSPKTGVSGGEGYESPLSEIDFRSTNSHRMYSNRCSVHALPGAIALVFTQRVLTRASTHTNSPNSKLRKESIRRILAKKDTELLTL